MLISHIDLSSDPKLELDDWFVSSKKVRDHVRGGKRVEIKLANNVLFVGGKKVVWYFHKAQENGGDINGPKFYRNLQRFPRESLLNIHVRDFLFRHQNFIPRSWWNKIPGVYLGCGRDLEIYFWGTTFVRYWAEPNDFPDTVPSLRLIEVRGSSKKKWERSYGTAVSTMCKTEPAAILEL
jgi:hypothetical protein